MLDFITLHHLSAPVVAAFDTLSEVYLFKFILHSKYSLSNLQLPRFKTEYCNAFAFLNKMNGPRDYTFSL